MPDSGLAAPGIAAPVTTWIGANTPVQSSADGQTLVTVQQTQQKAIANWSSFNVGQGTTLYFNQSAGNSSTGNSSGSCSIGCRTPPACRARSSAGSRPKARSM